MANIKVSALTALTGANSATDDVYVVVDTSATETKKQTRAELFKSIPAATFVGANIWNDAGADVDQRMEGDTDQNLFYLDAGNDRVGFGTNTPSAKVHVNGSFAINAPVTVTTNYTVGANDTFIISNRAATNTLTLPSAASCPGRMLWVLTLQAQTVNSASGNVISRTSTSAGTAIIAGTPPPAGSWALLVSNGSNWQIMAGG